MSERVKRAVRKFQIRDQIVDAARSFVASDGTCMDHYAEMCKAVEELDEFEAEEEEDDSQTA